MSKERLFPRHNFARSLKLLMAATGMTSGEIARRAGVDRKTINNQVNGRYDPRPELADAVAAVFGYEGWQLLSPSFDPESTKPTKDGVRHRLMESTRDLNDAQVELLVSVAQGMVKTK